MAVTEAAKRANKKYEKEKIDRVVMRVPKGKRELLHTYALEQGESLNAFLNRAVNEAIQRKPPTHESKVQIGKWVRKNGSHTYSCSICEWDTKSRIWPKHLGYKHCPNCGNPMR